ncbi:MAG: hypothetical protein O6704_05525 [Nitrospinae bacterium]|nr:hypothetical protein [Nitrospinota bacterium]
MAFGLISKSKNDVTMPSDDLESEVRKTRRDILGLKLMLVTAVILLVGGFFYYNYVLQLAQKESLPDTRNLQTQVNFLMQERTLGARNHIEKTMEDMVVTISRLDKEPPRVQQLIEKVKEDSGDFLHTYRQYSELGAGQSR